MTPGPTEVEQQVMDVLSQRPKLHYGEEWRSIYGSTVELSKKIFDCASDDQVIIVPAPASACLEMAIVNLVPPGKGKLLNICNGYFGEITKESAELHGIAVLNLKTEYGVPADPDEVRSVVEENYKDISAIIAVHNETSAGIVNPIEEIGKIASSKNIPFIVDAVSSFGAVETPMTKWNASICIGYPSKGLSGVPGITPMAIQRRLWDEVTSDRNDAMINTMPGRFMSFRIWNRYINEWGGWGHPFPTTMPTSVIVAFKKVLEIALEEGLTSRADRHRWIASEMRQRLRKSGFEILPQEKFASSTVSAIKMPSPRQDKVRQIMEREFGVIISGGLSELRGRIIRIGHMGATASIPCIERVLDGLEQSARLAPA